MTMLRTLPLSAQSMNSLNVIARAAISDRQNSRDLIGSDGRKPSLARKCTRINRRPNRFGRADRFDRQRPTVARQEHLTRDRQRIPEKVRLVRGISRLTT